MYDSATRKASDANIFVNVIDNILFLTSKIPIFYFFIKKHGWNEIFRKIE